MPLLPKPPLPHLLSPPLLRLLLQLPRLLSPPPLRPKTSQRAPLLLLRNVDAHGHQYLHIFIPSTNFYHHFLSPGVETIGEEVRSAPKEATRAAWRCSGAATTPRSPDLTWVLLGTSGYFEIFLGTLRYFKVP